MLVGPPARADELDEHLAELRPQLEDRRLPIADRERLALEMAANLDGDAQQAPTAEARRTRWAEAAVLLDEFRRRNPGHPRERAFALQSAVYRWAEAESWARQAELAPADPRARARVLEALDAAIGLLEPLRDDAAKPGDPFAQNVRYRLARALADRAAIEPEGAEAARRRSLALLEAPITEPALRGFAHLLQADLLTRLGMLDRAEVELDAAARSSPAPGVPERLEGWVALRIARSQFDEALAALEASGVDPATRDALAVRVLLARREDLPAGPARGAAEAELFRRLEALRRSGRAEARAALAAVARAIAEPDPALGPEARDALAEGELILGRPDRAGILAASAAEGADALGHRDQAAALRHRAAALLYQAGQFGQADALLSRIVADPKAGAVRPKAGLLRILARARLLERRGGDDALDSYLEALEDQVRDFPDDPGTPEARWRLGQARLQAGDRDRALALWAAIPFGAPRWLDARLVALDLRQGDLDEQLLNGDLRAARRVMDDAHRALDRAQAEAGDAPERTDLDLRRARLELTPEAGRPEAALAACDRLLRSVGRDEPRDRARRLRIVALALLGRTLEAERDARAEARRGQPDDLLDLARLLDRSASAIESDVTRRRLGGLIRTLMGPLKARARDLDPARRAETELRRARGILYSGDPEGARRALAEAAIDPKALADRLLDDLADTWARLESHPQAIDAYRLLARRRRPGTIPWLAARYGQALAYYEAGRPRDARQLIDGTAILHPNLGDGELRNQFERLRQRLAPE